MGHHGSSPYRGAAAATAGSPHIWPPLFSPELARPQASYSYVMKRMGSIPPSLAGDHLADPLG